MTADHSIRADRVLNDEKAQQPRWRRAVLRAPGWFSGKELDLLDPLERNKLYREERLRHPPSGWVALVLSLLALTNAVRSLHRTDGHVLWFAVVVGFVLLAIGAWLYRRRAILVAARRQVRESPDWPLRLQRVTFEASV